MRNPRTALLAILGIIVLALLTYACAQHDSGVSNGLTLTAGEDYIGDRGGGGVSEGMRLDSGLDKKVGAISPDEIASLPQYQQDLFNSGEWAEADMADGAGEAANPVASSDAYELSIAASIERWFIPSAYAQDTSIDERYLIRTGNLTTKVADFGASLAEVKATARKHSALVTDSSVANHGDNVREGHITLRVPNMKFFDCWEELNAIGDVQEATIGSEDVSRQYVAAVSRLKNLTQEQETLRKMLDEALAVQRSRGLGEGYKILLDTQSRLSQVTGQIETIENEISQLADRITRSTITVRLVQRERLAAAPEFSWGLGATFDKAKKDLVYALAGILNALVYFFVAGWLWLLPWALALFILWRVYKRYVAPKLTAPPPPAPAEQ